MSRIEPDNSLKFEVTPPPNTRGDNVIEALPARDLSSSGTGIIEKTHAQEISRTLKVMKIAGIYYGETNLVDFPSSCRRSHILGWLYSCVVVFILWIIVFTYLVDLAYAVDGSSLTDIFLSVLVSCWNVVCTGNATICALALPIGKRKASRFERFLSCLACTNSENKSKSQNGKKKKAFCFFISVVLVNAFTIFSDIAFQRSTKFSYEPWDQWSSSIRLFSRICNAVFGNVASIIPIYLFCTVCSILCDEYDDLEKEMENCMNSERFQVKVFRGNHRKLLTVVEMADKTFSSLVLLNLVCYIPMVLFIFHRLATFSSPIEDNMAELMALVYFGCSGIAVLVLLLWYGSRVNEKIHGFSRILQQSSFSPTDTNESYELLRVLLHLQGEPLGLTVGGLVVITKSFSWTVFGALISYFAVLLSLPQTSS